MRWAAIFGLLSVLVMEASLVVAQSKAPSSKPAKLTEVRVIGSKRYQPDELVAATGLKLGTNTDEDALKGAADRLAQSGMFGTVSYSYIAGPDGLRVKYELNDTDKLYPLHLDNFVWLPLTTLDTELRKREPLFRSRLPGAGEMPDRIAQDLKAILAEQHVAADVKVFPEAPQNGGDIIGFLYTVEGVSVPIQNVEFPGASSAFSDMLRKSAERLLFKMSYSVAKVRALAGFDLLPQYRMRGFLKATFGDPVAELQDRTTNSVSVQIPVSEGLQYKLSAVQWSGNTIFGADELSKTLKVAIGKPLDGEQLEKDLVAISKVYRTRGYMEAHLEPKFEFDDAAQGVVARLQVQEGSQYHFGNVEFSGLSGNAAAEVRKLWKHAAGDPYDSSYVNLFLEGAARKFNFNGLHVATRSQAHPETKTVDEFIQFSQSTSP